ncbi:MATE family efflux transporter [Bacillus pseudomycoides]|nr:MATE family efflux transporter [Bacillus pseudomycoides]
MAQANSKQRPTLTTGPIAKTLFLFALPILLGNVLQSLNGSINSIWVGKFLGEQALAATSNANIIFVFLLSSIFGIGMAATILIAQKVGAQNILEAKRVVGTSAVFFIVLSLIISLMGLLFSSLILDWMNTPYDAREMALTYTRIMFLGVPFMFGYNYIMSILRGSGDSKTPFYFLILSIVLDIILNPILIFGIGPFPNLGITGSALSTLIAQFISFTTLLVYLYRKEYFLLITVKELYLLRIDWSIMRILVKKGIPMGFSMVVATSSIVGLFSIINTFGSEATAAFGAASQISNYVQMPSVAIGGAVTSMAAQNIGAGNWDRVRRITWAGIGFSILLSAILVGLLHLFNRQVLSLFLPNTGNALHIGMVINDSTLWSFIIFGIMFVISGVVRANGAVIIPLLITFFALWIIRVPLSYYLGISYGLDTLWLSYPISFTIALVLIIPYYMFGKWKDAKMTR